jgi:hypothetical protein
MLLDGKIVTSSYGPLVPVFRRDPKVLYGLQTTTARIAKTIYPADHDLPFLGRKFIDIGQGYAKSVGIVEPLVLLPPPWLST